MTTLMPHIICAGAAQAIEFYKRAFGAEEQMRLPGQDGKLMHATVRIGDSMLMLVDENPALGVQDADVHLFRVQVDSAVVFRRRRVILHVCLSSLSVFIHWDPRPR